ncbi:MAG: nucleotidyltransferase family protein [Faecalibacterium sp.]|nr:nucleotidyltransferase family protein [Faecalibacterium sp.]
MRFAGIIAEYNPFHNGHAWQLAQARALGAQTVAVALSSGLVQRGALPLLPDRVRAEAALRAGADLVFALPAPWACSGAEPFARAGVALLAAAGCDTLVFGAETPNAALLMLAARTLLSAEYTAALKAQLAGPARSFAAARAAAAEAVSPGQGLQQLLGRPNDNLAVEYCKAVLQLAPQMGVCPLGRQGAQHDQSLPADGYASASALRQLWLAEGAQALAPYVPANALDIYRTAEVQGLLVDPRAADVALLSRLRQLAAGDFARIRGVNEGLEYLLEEQVRTAVTAEGLADALTGVRYPRARMRRLCMDAALGYTADGLPDLPPYLHLLGAKKGALPLLGQCSLPAGPSLAKLARENPACAAAVQAQSRADALGTLCRRSAAAMGECFTAPAVLLD